MPHNLLQYYSNSGAISGMAGLLINEPACRISLKGANGSLHSVIVSCLFNACKSVFFLVLPEKEEAAYHFNDLQQIIGTEKVMFFPASIESLKKADVSHLNSLDRILVLKSLLNPENVRIIVTYTEAVMEFTPSPADVRDNSITFRTGEEMGMDELIDYLNEIKFERSDFVVQPGQFSWRGGIIDVFSYDSEKPYRLEFAGDIIESVRLFDIESQLTEKQLQSVSITPDVLKINEESLTSVLKHLNEESVLLFKDLNLIVNKMREISENFQENSQNSNLVRLCHPDELLLQLQSKKILEFGQFQYFKDSTVYIIGSIPQPSFNKNFELLADNLRSYEQKGYTCFITASDSNQVKRFYEIFEDIGKDVHIHPVILSLHEGFVDNEHRLVCYTDHQIFGRFHKYRLRESLQNKQLAINLKDLLGLQPGDFITHIDHGVGRYSGLEKIDINGKKQEAIRIIYKNNDVLYISIHSLHRISKYIGKEGSEPVLDKLGSNNWKNLKQKTKTRVKELAFDLIKLYAERKTKHGFSFSPDSYLQAELEASFIYEDTPDQYKATQDVKTDMEASFPMDRLVCGDVGFGKTEIAIRAAFKAVNDSKQVAILVPTTILAMQHFKTFKSRLEQFPCKIDYLNRFRSAADKKKIIRDVEEGRTDIIIGTHMLLSEKIKFSDLGLMIIDEEQKFGVGAKDKLKTIKVNVDTLTLTATPIPRTLQFSMMGARDLSIINTPPPNRLPIETSLHEFSEDIIREAIDFEISRGGQVFFINNRIQNIGEIGGMISRLNPGAKVLVAHGQLKGHELEAKMTSFIEGEFDVLVSTTIVESGLDIPNANTIIINQANHFGLSDLHQMRGRVGRSNVKAFCYLLAPPVNSLTAHARKRLKAIEQFSELGSGFQIAMRDLDIRGAGDLFGAEQSGFISEIGFDMYQKILQEAISELKENEFKEAFKDEVKHSFVSDCQIETDLEILIPDDYISHIGERLSVYRELDEIEDNQRLESYRNSLTDRFGTIPKPALDLFDTIRLRWLAKSIGFEKLVLKNNSLICFFISNPESGFYQSDTFREILIYVQQNPARCKLTEKNEKLFLRFDHISEVHSAFEILSSMLTITA